MPTTRRSERQRTGHSCIEYHTKKSFNNEAGSTIFPDWIKFWATKNSMEPDLTVRVEDQTYLLHSTIMTFWSEYFQGNLKDHKPYMFELRDMRRSCFNDVLNFIYQGDFILNEESLRNIISIANELKIASILIICADYMIFNLRKNPQQIVDLVEFLCLSSNQYSLKIIIPQLFNRWDKFGSDDVLRRIPFKVLKLLISCSNKIFRLNDRNLAEICCSWISTDIERRFCHITELLELMTGKMNTLWNFDLGRHVPKNFADVKRIFDGLLHYCIDGQKIDFFNNFGLVIRKEDDPVVNRMIDDKNMFTSLCERKKKESEVSEKVQADISQFYFKQWQDRMKALRQTNTSGNIVVEVDAGQIFKLDYGMLCVSSQFFRDLDTNSRSHVRLNLTADEFVLILNFMYGEELNITSDNIYPIIRTSCLLKISSCQKLILNYLKMNIDSFDVLKLFENSFFEHNNEVFDFLKLRVQKNFDDFNKQSILSLGLDCFKWLMTSKSKIMSKLSIEDRLELCCDWVIRDIRNRYLSGPELFKAVSYLDEKNGKSVSEGLNFSIKLRKKILSKLPQPATDSNENPVYGHDFVISVPRIDLTTLKYKEDIRDVQENSQACRSFYIRVPRCIKQKPY